MIYMDNAATTLQKPEEVKQAILYALEHMGNAGRGGTEAALDASRSIYAVREKLADFFNAESDFLPFSGIQCTHAKRKRKSAKVRHRGKIENYLTQ